MNRKRSIAVSAVVITGILSAGVYASDLEEAESVQARDMADVSEGEEKEVNADSLSPSEEAEVGEKTVLSVMDEALAASEMNETENAFSDYFGYLMGNSYNLGFSMPGMEGVNQVRLDSGILNMQFICASNTLRESFLDSVSGEEARDCMELFESRYGDVLDTSGLEELHIPDSFDTSGMLESSRRSFEDAYESTIGSGAFAAVKNSVGIGGIFSAAQNPESIGFGGSLAGKLTGGGQLQSLLQETSSGQESTILGEYSSNKDMLDARGERERFDLQSRSVKNLMSMVDFSGSVLSPGGGGIQVNEGAAGGMLGRLSGMTQTEWKSRQDAQMEEYTRGFEDDVSDAVNIVISGIRTGTEEHAKVQASYSKTAEKLFESADKKYEEGDVSGSILDRMAGSAIVQTGGESGALTWGMH